MIQGAACLTSAKIPIANLHANGARGHAIATQVGRGAREQGEELPPELVVVVDVGRKGLVAADALRVEVRLDVTAIDATYAIAEPSGLALA